MANAIYIDSGHGGSDPGAVGNGLVERELNRQVCAQLVRRLRAHGLRVYTDLDAGNPGLAGALQDAWRHKDVALYYAQHHNAAGAKSARGYEIYKTGTGRSSRLGKAVHDAQLRALRSLDAAIPDRGVKEAKGTRAEAAVLRSPGSSVLSELLFVTNAKDEAIAKSSGYAAKLAEVTCRAIVDFGRAEKLWPTTYRPPAAPAPVPPPKPQPAPADPCTACKRQLADAERRIGAAKAALG